MASKDRSIAWLNATFLSIRSKATIAALVTAGDFSE